MHRDKRLWVGAALVILCAALVWAFGGGSAPEATRAVKPIAAVQVALQETHALAERGNPQRAADPAGTVRLEGQVIDGDEAPVPDAVVTISSSPPRVVKTEGDGSFVVEGLLPMQYTIEASARGSYAGPAIVTPSSDGEPIILRMREGHVLSAYVLDHETSKPIAGAWLEVRTGGAMSWQSESNEEGRAEIHGVRPGLASLHVRARGYAPQAVRVVTEETRVLLQRGVRVSGRVLGPGGRAVPDADVIAVPASEPFSLLDARDAVRTDADGAFHMEALRPGSYRMRVLHSLLAEGDAALVRVGSEPLENLEIHMELGAQVRGTVTLADGTPAQGASVQFVARGSVPWRARQRAIVNAEGRFEMTGLPRVRGDLAASNATSSSELMLVDVSKKDADVELELSVSGSIAGAVRASSGETVPEAQIFIAPVWKGSPDERPAWDARGIGVVLSDAGGKFSISGLPAGQYTLRAAYPGSPPSDALATDAVLASVGDDNVTIPLADVANVSGRVVGDDGDAILAFALRIGDGAPVAFSSSEGAFSLKVPYGERTLEVTGPGILPTTVALSIKSPKHDAGSITAKSGRALTGVVTQASGEPVSDATVVAGALLTGDGSQLFIPDESIMAQTTKTDSEGHFTLRGLAAFSITVVAGHEGNRSRYLRLPASKESAAVTLVLEPTSSLRGVATLDGEPIAETVVMASSLATSGMHFVVSGKDGRFAFDSLAPGQYSVYPMIGGGGSKPKDMYITLANVVEGESSEAVIEGARGTATLLVKAENEEGASAKGLVFVIEDPAGIVADGTYPPIVFTDGSWLRGRGLEGAVRVSLRNSDEEPARIEGLRAGRFAVCFGVARFGPPGPAQCRAETLQQGSVERLVTISLASP